MIKQETVYEMRLVSALEKVFLDERPVYRLYPDLLRELVDGEVDIFPQKWRSIWIDIEVTEDVKAGLYPVTVILEKDGEHWPGQLRK